MRPIIKKPKCLQCGKIFYLTSRNINQRYCSKICSYKSRTTKIQIDCKYCKKIILKRKKVIEKYKGKVFCNMSCASKYKQIGKPHACKSDQLIAVNNKKFRKNTIDVLLLGQCNSSQTLRKYLIALYGHQCQKCALHQWLGQLIPLEVEHKDGNSENNQLNNVCLICPNCHSQTPTYKGKNRGNGRFLRRQRYKKGLSY